MKFFLKKSQNVISGKLQDFEKSYLEAKIAVLFGGKIRNS